MAPRTSTKTKAAAEQAAATKPQDTPSGEQQEQSQQQGTPPAADQGNAQAQGDTPADGLTADYIEAAGFILNDAGDVVGADGLALPPVFAGDSGETMVLQALVLACVPALAPAANQVSVLTVDVDASAVTQAMSQAGELIGSQAVADVLAERARQISEKGYSADSDAQYQNGELAQAAACYALFASGQQAPRSVFSWPFKTEAFRPHDPRRAMVKAAAMLLAAIEAHDARAEA
jgi:hypothetical protein